MRKNCYKLIKKMARFYDALCGNVCEGGLCSLYLSLIRIHYCKRIEVIMLNNKKVQSSLQHCQMLEFKHEFLERVQVFLWNYL